ncbi:excalibur calcium-binding domain-containing protein [Phormidium nigroviride]
MLKRFIPPLLFITLVGCGSPEAEQQTPSPVVAETPELAPEAIAPAQKHSKVSPKTLLVELKSLNTIGSILNYDDSQMCHQQRSEAGRRLQDIKPIVEQAGFGAGVIELKLASFKLGSCLVCSETGIDACNEVKRLLIAADLKIKGKLPANNGELPECVSSECNCSDFKDKAEAQRVLFAFPDDPFKLDRDVDGVACE